ncbi:hypothetical protein M513_02335 [Trichuris suis]|uniref:Uncharacterized protein n=1 Tax=Trichuris suis TaxID=68888 RepID=A0A085MHG3_9BILA|nr:hypothetical protein M513_02335 [Trichuris suis]
MNEKLGIITGPVDRAVNLYDTEFVLQELRHICRKQRDFPRKLADKTIDYRITRLNGQEPRSDNSEESCPRLFLPYYPFVGQAIRRITRDLDLNAVFKSRLTLGSILRSEMIKTPPDQKLGALYNIRRGRGTT